MLHLHQTLPQVPKSIPYSKSSLQSHNTKPSVPISHMGNPIKITSLIQNPLISKPRCIPHNTTAFPATTTHDIGGNIQNNVPSETHQQGDKKNFWGAVGLIIGTAVGPGMLGLPAATIKSGSFPSTISIILCWVYVISSIILVAELSFSAMKEDGVEEVSFTGLATKAFGRDFGALVAVVYASLSFSLLVACVSGIGSIVSQWFPKLNNVLAHAIFPLIVGFLIGFFPFKAIDAANRFLCLLMLFSISALVFVGLSIARSNVLGSFAVSSWSMSSILPAIPVTVLTLGFHVITPFICKIAGDCVTQARKAVLIGGIVPLVMVLSWNLIVLGLAGVNRDISSNDPIALLLSVNPSALFAVQGFAFSALATSLIGYAVSFPKQLVDTLELIFQRMDFARPVSSQLQGFSSIAHAGRVGTVHFSSGRNLGNAGKVAFQGSRLYAASEIKQPSNTTKLNLSSGKLLMLLVLGLPVLIGSFFPTTFSRALDFAGVYANCFLFGILPPAMAYVQQFKKKIRSGVLPGGNVTLLLLFSIAVTLGIFH